MGLLCWWINNCEYSVIGKVGPGKPLSISLLDNRDINSLHPLTILTLSRYIGRPGDVILSPPVWVMGSSSYWIGCKVPCRIASFVGRTSMPRRRYPLRWPNSTRQPLSPTPYLSGTQRVSNFATSRLPVSALT